MLLHREGLIELPPVHRAMKATGAATTAPAAMSDHALEVRAMKTRHGARSTGHQRRKMEKEIVGNQTSR